MLIVLDNQRCIINEMILAAPRTQADCVVYFLFGSPSLTFCSELHGDGWLLLSGRRANVGAPWRGRRVCSGEGVAALAWHRG